MQLSLWTCLVLTATVFVMADAHKTTWRPRRGREETTTTTTTLATTSMATPTPVGQRRSLFAFPSDGGEKSPETLMSSDPMPNEIPPALLERLNGATDWEEFLEHVDGSFTGDGVEDSLDGRFGGGEERDASVPAKAANCIPELQTIKLVTENNDPTTIFYPTCTRIERCGGCCNNELLACEPTKVETVFMQVVKTQYVGGAKMQMAGKENVPVEKHTACKCQCRIKESDCSENQRYNQKGCKCECINIDDRRKCEAENQTRIWDPRECMCRCRDTARQCSTGFFFSEDICRCEPWISRRSGHLGLLSGEGSRSGSFDEPSVTNRDDEGKKPKHSHGYKTDKDDEGPDDDDKKSRPVQRHQFGHNQQRRPKP